MTLMTFRSCRKGAKPPLFRHVHNVRGELIPLIDLRAALLDRDAELRLDRALTAVN